MSSGNGQEGYHLGVDVGKELCEASVAFVSSNAEDWAKLPKLSFEPKRRGVRELGRWLKRFGGAEACLGVCVESTGVYSLRFAEVVTPLGLPDIAIVNPLRPLSYRRSLGLRDKSDKVDAAAIALYALHQKPKARKRLSNAHAKLGRLWRLRATYQEELLRFQNRLEQASDRDERRFLRETIRHLQNEMKKIWQIIEQHVEAEPELAGDTALLCSIPGIGMQTAVTLLGELGDLRQWSRKEIVSYAGLFPRVHESGKSVHKKPRLAKGGNTRLRTALFFPSLNIKRSKTPLGEFGRRLEQNGKSKMAVVGAIMARLLVLARGVVVSGMPYDQQRYGMNQISA